MVDTQRCACPVYGWHGCRCPIWWIPYPGRYSVGAHYMPFTAVGTSYGEYMAIWMPVPETIQWIHSPVGALAWYGSGYPHGTLGAWSLPIWWMHGNVGAQYMPNMHRYGYPYGGSTAFWMPCSCHSSTSSMIQHLQYHVCTIGVNRGCARD